MNPVSARQDYRVRVGTSRLRRRGARMAGDASGLGIPFGWALAIIVAGTPECTAILTQQPDN